MHRPTGARVQPARASIGSHQLGNWLVSRRAAAEVPEAKPGALRPGAATGIGGDRPELVPGVADQVAVAATTLLCRR